MYYVYQHINKINNKRYIGITKQKPSLRWGSNGINYKGSPVFWNALQKYGWNNFEHEILYSNLSKEDACHIEKNLIMEYKTQDRNFGYNITEGNHLQRSISKKYPLLKKANLLGNLVRKLLGRFQKRIRRRQFIAKNKILSMNLYNNVLK